MADVKKVATRQSYGEALKELGAAHPDVVVLDADLAIKGSVLDDPFLYQLADQLAQRDR